MEVKVFPGNPCSTDMFRTLDLEGIVAKGGARDTERLRSHRRIRSDQEPELFTLKEGRENPVERNR